jgi:hypothetical protein
MGMSYDVKWAPRDSNPGPTGYASHRSFRRPFRVCGLDYPFAPATGRLPSSLYTFPMMGLGSGLPCLTAAGFPEFDRFRPKITLRAALDRFVISRVQLDLDSLT